MADASCQYNTTDMDGKTFGAKAPERSPTFGQLENSDPSTVPGTAQPAIFQPDPSKPS